MKATGGKIKGGGWGGEGRGGHMVKVDLLFSEVREGDAWAETYKSEGASHAETVGRVSQGGGKATAKTPVQVLGVLKHQQGGEPAWKGMGVEEKRRCHRGAREQTCRAFWDVKKTLKVMSRVWQVDGSI